MSSNSVTGNSGGGIAAGFDATISHNLIQGNKGSRGSAIFFNGGSSIISNNTITRNTSEGTGDASSTLFVYGNPTINHNNIYGNTRTYELVNGNSAGSLTLDATNNWWGTTNGTEIGRRILDFFDDSARGVVLYDPYLLASEFDAPTDPSLPAVFTLTVTKTGTGSGTVTSSPAGIDCGVDCTEPYPSSTVVILTATPAAGSTFAGWSGACAGTVTCTLTIDAVKSVTATFDLRTFTLMVIRAGLGNGTVTSSPAGINCGTDCSESYNNNASVTLTANPVAGSTFAGWSGACSGTGACTVTLDAAKSVTATFNTAPPVFTLTVTQAGTGSGTVTSSPAGINCVADCSESYAGGVSVTLTAAAASSSMFVGWSGGGCSGVGACTVAMNAATLITATFNLVEPPSDPRIGLGTGSGIQGATVQIPITLTNVSGTSISAIGMDIGYDPNVLENPAATIGPSSSAAGKSVNTSNPSPGLFRIGIVGFNNTAMGDGIVGYVTFTIRSTASSGSTILINTPSASNPEGNVVVINGSNGSVTVSLQPPAALPDLVVTSITGASTGPIGGQTEISAEVANQGAGDAGPFRLEFYFSADSIITAEDIDSKWFCNVPGLAVGKTWTCSGPVGAPPSLTPGTYYLGAIVDNNDAVAEDHEDNNARSADTGAITLLPAFVVSGLVQDSKRAPIEKAKVEARDPSGALAGTALTNGQGGYQLYLLPGKYTLTSVKETHLFSPASRKVTIKTRDVSKQNFTCKLFQINGVVKDQRNKPLPGVAILLHQGDSTVATTTTDARGKYAFWFYNTGTYTVEPVQEGSRFNPPSIEVVISRGNKGNVNFKEVP